ncbi:hypothetical protein ACL02T_24795 [Pseudonocardia sp. RS010]
MGDIPIFAGEELLRKVAEQILVSRQREEFAAAGEGSVSPPPAVTAQGCP